MADVITRFKVESSEYERKIKSAKGQLGEFEKGVGDLTKALGINLGALTKLGAAVSAISTAVKVAKDAFFASEQNIDDWGRTVRSAQDVYQGFLTSLNTGDISGYLSRIDQIVDAAKEAYNELDRLGTQKAINNKKVQAQNAENQRMQMMLRTGRYIAPADGQRATMANGAVLSPQQLKNIERHYKAGLANSEKYITEYIDQINKSISALYTEQAKRLGMSRSEFLAGTQDMTAFDSKMAGAAQYVQWRREHVGASVKNPYSQYAGWAAFKDDGDLFKQINDLINERTGLQSQHYSNMGRAYRTMNRIDNLSGTGGGHSVTTTPATVEIKFKSKNLTEDELGDVLKAITTPQGFDSSIGLQGVENMFGYKSEDIGFTDADWDNEEFRNRMKAIEEGGKQARSAWVDAANAIGSVGGALQQINDPAAKVFGIIAEAIANVASGFAGALANSKTGKLSVWEWIAEAAAGTATMISTIAAIKSATSGSYAEGGIIGGSSYSGDRLQANVNSGELILNRAQQGNLASQLGGGLGNLHLETTISGENLRVVLNNNSRRRGRGEYVTSRG